MILSLSGLVFGLANENLTMMEKIPLVLICFFLMMFGVLVETPILEQLREGQNQLQEDSENKFQ